MDGEIGRMGASLMTTWEIEETIHQQMEVELGRWQSAGEEVKKAKLQALILDVWCLNSSISWNSMYCLVPTSSSS